MKSSWGLKTYAVLYLAFLYIPVLLLPLFSFNDGTIVSFPIKGWTLQWYQQLGEQETLISALVNSLLVGTVSAATATAFGLLASMSFVRYKFRGKAAAEGLVMLPLVIPGIIVASSMLVLFISVGLKPSLGTVILGHTFLAIPFSVSIMKSSFDNFDMSLEEASYDLGVGALETFRRVTLPLVTPGIASSFLVTFTVSFDEFVLAFFLSGNSPTLPVYIWSQIRFPAKLPNTLALGSLMLLASIFLLVLAEYFRRRATSSDQKV